MSRRGTTPHSGARWLWVAAAAALIAGLAILGRLWWMTARGLDLTDEGMYLNWLTAPWDWPWASTQFAFLFHPLWALVGQDLVWLRRWTVALLLLAGAGFFAVVFRRGFGQRRAAASVAGVVLAPTVALPLGSQSLFFTPSYNMLGLFGLLLSGAAVMGILLPVQGTSSRGAAGRNWPWALLGVGGVVCFASRPTAGALLLIIVLAALLAARAWSWAGLGLAAGTALAGLLVLALAIDGNPVVFLQRVLEGLHLYSLQTRRSAADALINTFTHPVVWQPADILVGVLLGVAVTGAVIVARSTAGRAAGTLAWVAAALALVGAWVAVAGVTPLAGKAERSVTVAFFLWLGATLPAVWGSWRSRRRVVAAAGALWLLPFAFAFATHYSTTALAGCAAFCWLAASLLLVGSLPGARGAWPVVGAVWLLATALCLNAAMGAHPRQAPLQEQSVDVSLAEAGTVKLSPEMAQYLGAVEAGLAAAGFEEGAPILDLTGESPGLIHHLQARATADSWVIGRYPGSRDRLSRELLLHTGCDVIGHSWLLVSPDGARRIDPEVLGDVGISFPGDYRRALTATAPERSGSYQLEVWEPVDADALTARCAAVQER